MIIDLFYVQFWFWPVWSVFLRILRCRCAIYYYIITLHSSFCIQHHSYTWSKALSSSQNVRKRHAVQSLWIAWRFLRLGPFTSRLCQRYWATNEENKLNNNKTEAIRFSSSSTRPLSAIPMLSLLEPSATSASSSKAIFQRSNTSKQVKLHTLKSDA